MKRLIIAGFFTFLIVLIATFPARVAYNWLAPPEIQLSGISGSIWNGTATEGKAGGAYIQNLAWQFKPMALLGGKLAFTASGNPAAGTMNTEVALGLDGNLTLSDFVGSVPLDLVHQSFQQGGIRGDVVMQLDSLVIKNGLPVAAQGAITVRDFFAPLLSTSEIGDFRADFLTTDIGIVGNVKDMSAVLDVTGTITLTQNGSYTFIGEVGETAETPRSITDQLRYLGSADEQGRRPFRFEGQL
jgi:general secretion pathway protein N